jgi:hypothetical protein
MQVMKMGVGNRALDGVHNQFYTAYSKGQSCFLFQYGALAFIALLESFSEAVILTIFALGIFIWFSIACLKRYRGVAAVLFSFTFAKINFLISLIAIANHFYITELGIFATRPVHAGLFALIACSFMHIACVVGSRLILRHLSVPLSPLSFELKLVTSVSTIALSWIVILFLFGVGFSNGFPLLTQTDRFEFRSEQSTLFLFLINAKTILATLLGLARYGLPTGIVRSRLIELTMVVLILISLLFGDKFGSLIVMIVAYFLVKVALSQRPFEFGVPLLAGVALLMGLAGSATYYIYSDYGESSYDTTMEKILGRATGYGQLWYVAINDDVDLINFDGDQFSALATLAVSRGDTNAAAFDNHVGVFYMVRRYAAARNYASIEKAGGLVQFTGATEGYFLLIGGILIMIIFLFVLAVVTGVISYYMLSSIFDGSGLGIFAASYLLGCAYVVSNQAQPWVLFGIRTLVYGGVVIAMDYLVRTLARSTPAKSVRYLP